jgi:hypothetical protein
MVKLSSNREREGKKFEICKAGLEFELEYIFFVKAWDSRGFTHSPRLTKCVF